MPIDRPRPKRDSTVKMPTAFSLALRQLFDRSILRILIKCIAITLAIFVVLATVSWYALHWLLDWAGLTEELVAGADGIRGALSIVLMVIGGWLLWRILAVAVLQFHADEVVKAVEAKHYPTALASAKTLPFNRELRIALRGALRALGYNLLAAPVALFLLFTAIGPAIVFLLVNAVLVGRELTEMVWVRHEDKPDAPLPVAGHTIHDGDDRRRCLPRPFRKPARAGIRCGIRNAPCPSIRSNFA
ncbi:MAG: EI24 domain-containing protein [Sphingomonadaceae bacterium]